VCGPVTICLSSGPNPPCQKRGPPKGCVDCSEANLYLPTLASRYVESLESRLEKMESLLQRVRRPVGLVSVTFSSYLAVSRRRLYARTRSAD
jgi:hypothetical protein